MAGIARSSELRQYTVSEWKAGVGYLVKEFEVQKEIQRSKRMGQTDFIPGASDAFRDQFINWIFGRRKYIY
jgi:hypothetical protein